MVVALVEVEEDEDEEDVLLAATGAEVVLTLKRLFRLWCSLLELLFTPLCPLLSVGKMAVSDCSRKGSNGRGKKVEEEEGNDEDEEEEEDEAEVVDCCCFCCCCSC